MWLLMNDLGLKARLAFSKFMCDEEGDVNIVSIVVLILALIPISEPTRHSLI